MTVVASTRHETTCAEDESTNKSGGGVREERSSTTPQASGGVGSQLTSYDERYLRHSKSWPQSDSTGGATGGAVSDVQTDGRAAATVNVAMEASSLDGLNASGTVFNIYVCIPPPPSLYIV